jgi:hypothetical protein
MVQRCQSWKPKMCGIGEKMTLLFYEWHDGVNHERNSINIVQMVRRCQSWMPIMCGIGEKITLLFYEWHDGVNREFQQCVAFVKERHYYSTNGTMFPILNEMS